MLQISLKDALFGGLDYSAAMGGTQPGLVRLQASAQARMGGRVTGQAVWRGGALLLYVPASPPACPLLSWL